MTEHTVKKKIAITGAKGFVGRRLSDALRKAGHEVVELDLPEQDIRQYNTLSSLDGCDTVFHLATMPLPACKIYPRECIHTNIEGTLNVVEACMRYNVRRLVYTSASSIYGDPVRSPVREDDLKKPLTIYGVTKLAAENVIGALISSKTFTPSCAIFRPTNIYGSGQTGGLIPTVIKKLRSGEVIEVNGTGKQTRDFVYIDDVVMILMRAMYYPLYNLTMNLGSGEETSVNRVIEMCAEMLGKTPKTHHNPYDLDRSAFRADTTVLNRIYEGYSGMKFTPFREGLMKTIEGYEAA